MPRFPIPRIGASKAPDPEPERAGRAIREGDEQQVTEVFRPEEYWSHEHAAPYGAPDREPTDTYDPVGAPEAARPGFRDRARMRRQLLYLRRLRELAFRDLGGLVFELHRHGQRRDELVLAKLGTLEAVDGELRTLEHALETRQPLQILREAGIAPCQRCGAVHGSDANYCHGCGAPIESGAPPQTGRFQALGFGKRHQEGSNGDGAPAAGEEDTRA